MYGPKQMCLHLPFHLGLSGVSSVTTPQWLLTICKFGVRFLSTLHTTVFLSLQSFLCSSSTMECLSVGQFPLHLLVSDFAHHHDVRDHIVL
mmetsp:Transcript_72402/g.121560  ORF Transcript_72402/g.121560 Transcript_72402/m.121560 type:complete len:91 (+) Transcript_72402:110-382(+)